ncbi:SDR family oxidoreductase [Porticoccus sp. W117]|uniref:SDR family NAD(P)-dependent oxidoreductase n=1 Tax=Porticoccus sp. W117 TaxID=3054777 RepID=UPI002598DB39|nr:SDR family oxidoreductase [Porticoccus sp. W117]MDM3870054.1 SDR family oxidoreductase [Porticoccus sp. W117]
MSSPDFISDAKGTLDNATNDFFPKYKDLSEVGVFITGGGSGIGAAMVAAFAVQGAKVGFVSLTQEPANQLCEDVEQQTGNRPHYYPCDIRDIYNLGNIMRSFQEDIAPIRVLVNNAARDTRHDVSSYTPEQWDDAMNTNLRPHYFTAQYAVDGMRKVGGGSIINLGSNSAILGLSGYPAYVASKAGIIGLTKALARELGPDNIRVNCLIPGWVMTERQKKLWVTPEALQECLDQQSLKSTISCEDVAQSALFLAANASAMITGQSLIIDGGRV